MPLQLVHKMLVPLAQQAGLAAISGVAAQASGCSSSCQRAQLQRCL